MILMLCLLAVGGYVVALSSDEDMPEAGAMFERGGYRREVPEQRMGEGGRQPAVDVQPRARVPCTCER